MSGSKAPKFGQNVSTNTQQASAVINIFLLTCTLIELDNVIKCRQSAESVIKFITSVMSIPLTPTPTPTHCPPNRTDLDKLAQLAQIFSQADRKALQRALARADGDAAVAIELLLAPSDAPDGRLWGDSAFLDANNSDRLRGGSGGGGRVRFHTVAGSNFLSAPGDLEAVSGHNSNAGGGGGASHVGRVTSSLSAALRRSGSGRWYGGGGGGGVRWSDGSGEGFNIRHPPRLNWRSRAVIQHYGSSDEEGIETMVWRADDQGSRMPQRSAGTAPTRDDRNDGTAASVTATRFAGSRAGEAGALVGAAAAAQALESIEFSSRPLEISEPPMAPAAAAAAVESEQRSRRPVSYSAGDSLLMSNRAIYAREGTLPARRRSTAARSLSGSFERCDAAERPTVDQVHGGTVPARYAGFTASSASAATASGLSSDASFAARARSSLEGGGPRGASPGMSRLPSRARDVDVDVGFDCSANAVVTHAVRTNPSLLSRQSRVLSHELSSRGGGSGLPRDDRGMSPFFPRHEGLPTASDSGCPVTRNSSASASAMAAATGGEGLKSGDGILTDVLVAEGALSRLQDAIVAEGPHEDSPRRADSCIVDVVSLS